MATRVAASDDAGVRPTTGEPVRRMVRAMAGRPGDGRRGPGAVEVDGVDHGSPLGVGRPPGGGMPDGRDPA